MANNSKGKGQSEGKRAPKGKPEKEAEILLWLKKEFESGKIAKGLEEIGGLVSEKTGKAEIVYESPKDLEEQKDKIISIVDKLKRKGIAIEYSAVGKRIKLTSSIRKGQMLEEGPLLAEDMETVSMPAEARLRKKVAYTVENMRLHQEILKSKGKPVLKIMEPEAFYKHFETHFLIPLSDVAVNSDEYLKYAKRILGQVYELNTVEKLENVYSISIQEIKQRRKEELHWSVFDSFKEQLSGIVTDEKRHEFIVKLVEKYVEEPTRGMPVTDSMVALIGRLLEDAPGLKDTEMLSYFSRMQKLIEKHMGEDDPLAGVLKELG